MEKLCFHKHTKTHNVTHHHIPKKEEEESTVIMMGRGTTMAVSWLVLFAMVVAIVT